MANVRVMYSTQWYGNGCDCCEPTPFDLYKLYIDGVEVSHTDGEERYFSSIEDCYEFALKKLGNHVEVVDDGC
jgi:hypothetical protein